MIKKMIKDKKIDYKLPESQMSFKNMFFEIERFGFSIKGNKRKIKKQRFGELFFNDVFCGIVEEDENTKCWKIIVQTKKGMDLIDEKVKNNASVWVPFLRRIFLYFPQQTGVNL